MFTRPPSYSRQIFNPVPQPYTQPGALAKLPNEVVQTVFSEAHADPAKREGTRALHNLTTSNRFLKSLLEHDRNTHRSHEALKGVVKMIHRLPPGELKDLPLPLLKLASIKQKDEGLDEAFVLEDDELRLEALSDWAKSLPALNATQRDRLVEAAVELEDPSLEEHLSQFIAKMGSGLHVLSPQQRSDLVDILLLEMTNEGLSTALCGFGQGLASLEKERRDELVNTVVSIEDEEYQSKAIVGLSAGAEALKPEDHQALIDAAKGISQVERFKADALSALGGKSFLFTCDQLDTLIDATLSLADATHAFEVARDMAEALPDMSPDAYNLCLPRYTREVLSRLSELDQLVMIHICGSALRQTESAETNHAHARLIDLAFTLREDDDLSYAIAGLGGGLRGLTLDQRERLVEAGLAFEHEAHRSAAIEGLGGGLGALDTHQRSGLVDAALAIEDESLKGNAIRGLAANMQALDEAQRLRLVDATLGMTNEAAQSYAIRGFGQAIKAIPANRLNALVQSINRMTDPDAKLSAIQGIANATGPHRDQLLDQALTLDPEHKMQALDWLMAEPS